MVNFLGRIRIGSLAEVGVSVTQRSQQPTLCPVSCVPLACGSECKFKLLLKNMFAAMFPHHDGHRKHPTSNSKTQIGSPVSSITSISCLDHDILSLQ